MVEIDSSDELIDLAGKDVFAAALNVDETRIAAIHLSHVDCLCKPGRDLLHASLFHIVSLLGQSNYSCAAGNPRPRTRARSPREPVRPSTRPILRSILF